MKKTILMAVLLTVISAVSFAKTVELSETTKFQVVENTDSRYDLYYVSENSDDVMVRIMNANGEVVSTDKIQDVRAFKRTYNFKDLPAGNYEIEVKNKEGKASQPVFHNPSKAVNLHSIVGKLPNENRFKVLVGPSETSAEPIKVKIYNQRGEVLLEETIDDSNGFSKIYDLSTISGDYVTFHLSKGQEEASYTRDLK
ncbi:MAG: hypothetical protein KDC79_01225 [Cyclobacteriaceae bacterium]|nr:hypothetical protein [Cyclobacteriaceae bacterium]